MRRAPAVEVGSSGFFHLNAASRMQSSRIARSMNQAISNLCWPPTRRYRAMQPASEADYQAMESQATAGPTKMSKFKTALIKWSDVSIVDLWWPQAYVLQAWVYALSVTDGLSSSRKLATLVLVTVWGVRLAGPRVRPCHVQYRPRGER